MAIGEAGIIPYYTNVRIVDMFGLMDTHNAGLPGGHFGKTDVSYVLGREPQYILVAHVVRGASGALTSMFLYDRAVWADERFARQYTLLREFADNPRAGSTSMLHGRRAGQ